MANTRTANNTESVSLKTAFPKAAFLKSVLFRLFLLIGIVALPSFAFAIDTDGDGVDDSVDAFPNNIEASVDTDGDGKPDWFVQTVEGFENMGAGYAVISPWSTLGAGRLQNSAYSGLWGIGIGSSSYLRATLPTSTSFSFWGKSSINYSLTVSVDGVSHTVNYTSTWKKYTIQTSPGSHVIQWNSCSGGLCFGIQIDDVSYNPASTLVEDLDDDNDGFVDTQDAFPLDNTQVGDIDVDGIDGFVDNCITTANADQLNTDGDTQGNVCDADDDNDGVADTSDKFPLNIAASSDPDVDGFADSWNAACNATCQTNSGLVLDNCPSVANADQLNTDGDTQGNMCDGNDDNDGVIDAVDSYPLDASRSAGVTGILNTFNGDSANDYFGQSVSAAGDVNNDGYDDVIVGAYLDDNNGSNSGSARVLSGANGAILYTFNGDSADDFFGRSVSAAGDVNNDGYDDVIVGSDGDDNNGDASGSARVFSGATGAILYTFNGGGLQDYFGYSVSAAGDVNNDGYADVIVGAYGDAGSARVLSGANGAILYSFNGDSAGDAFGFSVSGAGDVNNDGYADVIVGDFLDDNNGTDSGSARVLSGANGATLHTFNGESAFDVFGSSVSAAGDVNNDGFADVIVGAHGDDNNGDASGSARVFSGASGAILYTFNGDGVQDDFGYSVSAAGDVNNDGFDDVIVGAYQDDNNGHSSGAARVLSGANGSILYVFNGDSATDNFGYSVSSAGDVNNDGFADLIVGAYQDDNNGSNSGSARLFSGRAFVSNWDGTGLSDALDADDDNDGILDINDATPIGNRLDADSDGVGDSFDALPLNPSEYIDTDFDGTGNNADNDDDNDGLPDAMDPLPLQAKFNLNAPYKGSQVGDQNAVQ